MHKDFYASGFLYHPPSEKILLQQSTSVSNTLSWGLFGGTGLRSEKPETTFQHIIATMLDIKVNVVYPVYFYPYQDTTRSHYIVYAKVQKRQNFVSKNGMAFAWFSLKQICKLHLAQQTEHDITVGIRVIDASIRKRLGQHYIE